MMRPMLTIAAALVTLALLAGCAQTPEGQIVRDVVKTRGAAIADAGLENAMWFACNAATIGSVRRMFGRDATSAINYRALCTREGVDDVIGDPAAPPPPE